MSLEDDVEKIMWDAVRASQPALEADIRGGEYDATQDELLAVLIDRCNGIAEAVRRLAREMDEFRAGGVDPG